MPRTARSLVAGGCYHLINRGNNRATLFASASDFSAFLRLMAEAQARIELDLLAACLMPNHFHLVASPRAAADASRWMQWLLTTHGHRHHLRLGSSGRVWQGRFKAFPIERDEHLLAVMRYVERNPLRAGLVARAQDWRWGSLAWRTQSSPVVQLSAPPVPLPSDWLARVNQPQSAEELADLRACVHRQRPYGSDAWVETASRDLGLESSVRRRGRPRKAGPQDGQQATPRTRGRPKNDQKRRMSPISSAGP
jgi:putative transposase